MTFVATNKVPGVYIDEIQVAGPIAGVGTSTVAIIGPARTGPINIPTLVTNPTQFTERFGGYFPAPMVYATHAVHGFFANGGTTCYFVRVGTAARAFLNLLDRSAPARPTLVVTAKQEGLNGDNITVEVQDSSIATVSAARAESNLAGTGASLAQAEVADASNFRPGDIVLVEEGATNERATIASINTSTAPHTLTFQNNLINAYTNAGTVRVADLAPGQATFRVSDTAGIEAGSYVQITQDGTSEDGVVDSVEGTNHLVTLEQGLTNTYTMAAADPNVQVQTLEFTLIVTPSTGSAENFTDLALDNRHSHYFASRVSSSHVDVTAVDPPNPTLPTDNRPAVIAATALAGGSEDDVSALTSNHYQSGINALESIDEVNMLCVPDRQDQTVQLAMIAHCAKMKERFAILDSQRNASPSNGVRTQRDGLASDRGFGAFYYPWIVINDPNPDVEGTVAVPPSGHIAGVFARTDNTKGVHKAPANEQITGVLDLERTLNETEMGLLNENSINVLRGFRGGGFRIWGARTLSTRTQWRYVNVRRLMLFIEESIQEGTRFAVFEPNNQALWQTVKRQVTGFLTGVWRDGALFGATPEDAFRVRVDEEPNPATVRALGQLIIEVIVYPTTPAEFIVFRIIQEPGGPTVQE